MNKTAIAILFRHFLLSTLHVAIFCTVITSVHAQQAISFHGVKKLTERIAPWLAPHVEFSFIPQPDSVDIFELSSIDKKIIIKASSASAASMAVHHYLKYYCNRSMGRMAENLSPVSPLPLLPEKVTYRSPYKYRYSYNYCPFNYSFSFYGWDDWEKELDNIALSGVNLALAITGTEIIWKNTLQQFGYSDKEIKNFIAGPAFTSWWLMGNLEGWGGPVSDDFIEGQMVLQKKILARMKELGIDPVPQGFYGMVPRNLKEKFPSATIYDQGQWGGEFLRPPVLNPGDPLFAKMSAEYYKQIKNIYGTDFKYFSGDLFHEGGNSKGIDVKSAATAVQQSMMKAFPKSTWVLMGWSGNPREQFMAGLDRRFVLIQNLFGEASAEWEKTKAFYGASWLWCTVSNFGEKNGLYGKLDRFVSEIERARKSPYGKYMKGIGMMPEGLNNNPVCLDLIAELGWENIQKPTNEFDLDQWLNRYILYRYGKSDPRLEKAWKLLLKTVYSSPPGTQEGAVESLFCARPADSLAKVSIWGTARIYYDPAIFEEAAALYEQVAPLYSTSSTFQYDLTDIIRQRTANKGQAVYWQMMKAFKENNLSDFTNYSDEFLTLILEQDKWVSRNEAFRLDTWLKQASDKGKTPTDKRTNIRNARMLTSVWGSEVPSTNLRDYSNREWSGLLSDLYYKRWEAFIRYKKKQLQGIEAHEPDFWKMEWAWSQVDHN